MEDKSIIDLFFERSDEAIRRVQKKYSNYLMTVAKNILYSPEDSCECVNSTYLRAWNTIPPQRPERLSLYLAKITRELAIDRWRRNNAEKRGGGQCSVSLDELSECMPAADSPEGSFDAKLLSKEISEYLRTISETARDIFVWRYYFCDSIKDIAERGGISETNVRTILSRTRAGLKKHLEKEGFTV